MFFYFWNQPDELDYSNFRQFTPPMPPMPPMPPFFPPDGGSFYNNSPSGPPSSPPPSFTPEKNSGGPGLKAVDPGAIRPCKYRNVYIWLNNGRGFWAWLTYVGRRSVAGWRWNRFTWEYFGIDTRKISSFSCY